MAIRPGSNDWDPTSPEAWAALLGLVPVPLFGTRAQGLPEGSHRVLLDGPRASCAMSSVDTPDLGPEPLSWSWSSNLRHFLTIDRRKEELFLRRWDSPGPAQRLALPARVEEAQQILEEMEAAPALGATNVIDRLLGVFRKLRQVLPNEAIDAICVLNVLLVGVEKVRSGELRERDWLRHRTVNDAIRVLDERERDESGATGLGSQARRSDIRPFFADLLAPQPGTRCQLDPDLLLRHASSKLYQEAHIHIERRPQLSFLGFESDSAPSGAPAKKDVRFTPPTLARTLAQKALDSYLEVHAEPHTLRVLDPACGSGVFLQEMLRELCRRQYRGAVEVVGYDTSPMSRVIATFCLARAERDARTYGIHAQVSVRESDALQVSWGRPDIILMNPPFVSWERLEGGDREAVQAILGDCGFGRADMAMAFLWKAVQSLRPGGALASVAPAALLGSKSALKLREKFAELTSARMIGRFEGVTYFTGAKVEPAFLVLQAKTTSTTPPTSVEILWAAEGADDAALRALRRRDDGELARHHEAWDISHVSLDSLSATDWSPRPVQHKRITDHLARTGLPRVKALFDVKQGTLTGDNEVFIMLAEGVEDLPEGERANFRPIAGNSTIKEGQLAPSAYAFYPYDTTGLTLKTEAELKAHVATYFKQRLKPARQRLAARQRVDREWWELARPRSWQRQHTPKLVSTYFGDKGSFAYDEEGNFLVMQGFAWIWKADGSTHSDAGQTFQDGPLPWAYLALLNSSVFEDVLACSCPRMDGRQYNLSKRFVEECFLPDLADSTKVNRETTEELARLGRLIHQGKLAKVDYALSRAASRAYGVPISFWPSVAGQQVGSPENASPPAVREAIEYIDLQLGASPWMDIAELVLATLTSHTLEELTLPLIADLAERHGFKWQDVHLVVEKLSRSDNPYLERLFVSEEGRERTLVPEDEVKRRLRLAMKDPENAGRDWQEWSSGVRVIWRLPRPSRER